MKLSDALVLDARLADEVVERSIAGQAEYWAWLGRSVEGLLDGQQIFTLCRRSGDLRGARCDAVFRRGGTTSRRRSWWSAIRGS